MFKGLSNLAGLMQQARELQARTAEMKDRLAELRIVGTSGGGMVTVEATGDQRLTAVRIEPSLLVSGDSELLEDLVLSAANQALDKSRAAAAEEMQNLAVGLNLPGMGAALASLGFGGPGTGNSI